MERIYFYNHGARTGLRKRQKYLDEIRRDDTPDRHEVQMRSVGGYTPGHDVTEPVQQQARVCWRLCCTTAV